MARWKMPPKAKVYEALSAVADGRVKIKGPTEAEVISSSGNNTYSIEWSEDMRQITSNDNASYWQGYIGYPIIAVLLEQGRIEFKQDIAKQLAGVPWKQINAQFKRDYEKAVDSVLRNIQARGADRDALVHEVEQIYERLDRLQLERGSQRRAPPAR